VRSPRDFLGCQIWFEPDDSAAHIDQLFGSAAATGLGWARLFLMWPWIEAKPGVWNFDVFDHAFDAGAKYDMRIKATLTANSGPWHIGTPSLLHAHTGFLSPEQDEPMRRYIRACVERYARHPALGQWILWNEPYGGNERTEAVLVHWRAWLRDSFQGDLARLNHRWRTGYRSFDEIPFPAAIPHDAHKGDVWNSYGPWLADWQARSQWLNHELTWVRDIVREIDPHTPTCVNPTVVLENQAVAGVDLDGLGRIVDVVGASYHPAWAFMFAERTLFPALMTAGVRAQAMIGSIRHVEVTEVQSGNTVVSANKPCGVTPGELARFYLAGLAGGAESVTGWALNVRGHDFEAGDWGLLDDMDQPSERSRMLRYVHDRLGAAFERTGAWKPAETRAWVASDPRVQAIEWIEARSLPPVPGRLANDGIQGAALLAAVLMQCGISTSIARTADLPDRAPAGGLLVLSHMVAWEASTAERALAFAASGGTVLVDAMSGRKNLNASLHRPWPGGMAEQIGLRAAGLESRPDGYEILLAGLPAGRWLLTRLIAELDPNAGWHAWPDLRYAYDGAPSVWERPFGRGRVVVARGILGPSLLHSPECRPAMVHLLKQAGAFSRNIVSAVSSSPATFAVPVGVERGTLTAVFAPDLLDRAGQSLRLYAPANAYLDLWTGQRLEVAADRELSLPAPDGIALLWSPPAGEEL
jgi:hypothetical protein